MDNNQIMGAGMEVGTEDAELAKLLLGDEEEVVDEELEGDEETALAVPTRHSLTTMEVMARMTDNKIETKEFIDEWLLLTFDIPTTKEGNKARAEFYKRAYSIGAIQNTESVYLCPWTPETELLALDLAAVSNSRVIVWSRAKTSAEQSREITQRYDAGLHKVLKLIEKRIDALDYMIQKQYHKKAARYTIKTERLLDQVEQAILRRGSAGMLLMVAMLNQRFSACFARI